MRHVIESTPHTVSSGLKFLAATTWDSIKNPVAAWSSVKSLSLAVTWNGIKAFPVAIWHGIKHVYSADLITDLIATGLSYKYLSFTPSLKEFSGIFTLLDMLNKGTTDNLEKIALGALKCGFHAYNSNSTVEDVKQMKAGWSSLPNFSDLYTKISTVFSETLKDYSPLTILGIGFAVGVLSVQFGALAIASKAVFAGVSYVHAHPIAMIAGAYVVDDITNNHPEMTAKIQEIWKDNVNYFVNKTVTGVGDGMGYITDVYHYFTNKTITAVYGRAEDCIEYIADIYNHTKDTAADFYHQHIGH
ncbi:hypothetical protein MIDIC_470015 [Alphaproteobacteria bacterium]